VLLSLNFLLSAFGGVYLTTIFQRRASPCLVTQLTGRLETNVSSQGSNIVRSKTGIARRRI
jgi:hypothetical protein